MNWWWLGLSFVGGVAAVLADQYRVQAKKGEPWLGQKPRLLLAFLIPSGMLGGWFAFYYGPPILYRGAVAFVELYTDPARPLLKFAPALIGIVCFGVAATLADLRWRRGIEARRSGAMREGMIDMVVAWLIVLGGVVALAIGTIGFWPR